MDFLADTGATDKEIQMIIEGSDTQEQDGQISYEEFLEMFHMEDDDQQRRLVKGLPSTLNLSSNISLDEAEETKTEGLLGIDAVIPGGKHDTARF